MAADDQTTDCADENTERAAMAGMCYRRLARPLIVALVPRSIVRSPSSIVGQVSMRKIGSREHGWRLGGSFRRLYDVAACSCRTGACHDASTSIPTSPTMNSMPVIAMQLILSSAATGQSWTVPLAVGERPNGDCCGCCDRLFGVLGRPHCPALQHRRPGRRVRPAPY